MNRIPLDFEEIYQEYHDSVVRYLTRMVGPTEATDVTQEVFSKIGKGLQQFDGRAAISTWIFHIATNSAYDWWRNNRKKRLELHLLDEVASLPSNCIYPIGPKKDSPLELIITAEMNTCIREQIDKLPEIYKTVLILNSLQEFQNKEIAEILGVNLSAVKYACIGAEPCSRKYWRVNAVFTAIRSLVLSPVIERLPPKPKRYKNL